MGPTNCVPGDSGQLLDSFFGLKSRDNRSMELYKLSERLQAVRPMKHLALTLIKLVPKHLDLIFTIIISRR